MATYLVTVHKTPGMTFIDSRKLKADDLPEAIIKAKRLANIMLSRRPVAKYRVWFTLLEFAGGGTGPKLVAKGPLSREKVHGR